MGQLILVFLGALVLTNAVPHLANGLSGRPFQSPFARPMGQGLSSAMVNVAWGVANLALAWALLVPWGGADLTRGADALTALVAALFGGLGLAWSFGRFNGGNAP